MKSKSAKKSMFS